MIVMYQNLHNLFADAMFHMKENVDPWLRKSECSLPLATYSAHYVHSELSQVHSVFLPITSSLSSLL